MSKLPDNVNLQKRRAERKRTERSLEKFVVNASSSALAGEEDCRNRINSVFRLKIRDLQEVRNKKKMSQSMIRARQFELGTDWRKFDRKDSQEQSPLIKQSPQIFIERFNKNLESIEHLENESKKNRNRVSKQPRSEDPSFTPNLVKSSLQGIITPVVQISYNQIKNVKDNRDSAEKDSTKGYKPIYSHRSNRVDLSHTVHSLNSVMSRKAKSDRRDDSFDRSVNKGSFISTKEAPSGRSPQVPPVLPDNPSTSFQQQLNTEYDEDGTDEHYPGESLLKNRANSINTSIQYNKRSMSEMQKSLAPNISISKATHVTSNRFRDKNKNQIFATLNGIKTVSLNGLTGSTKSGGQSSARQIFKNSHNGVLSSYSGPHLKLNYDGTNLKLNSSGNNNSISSLKLNDKNLLIDLGNHSKAESYYSPLARDRSNTINSSREVMFNKWKSSKSISSNGQGSSSQLKPLPAKVTNTPYRNIKLSAKKFDNALTTKVGLMEPVNNFEERCETLEQNPALGHNKNVLKYRGLNSVKNNIDVQKVREAILGSIDTANSEYWSYEKRKMRFLNSLDESKDFDLFKQKFR